MFVVLHGLWQGDGPQLHRSKGKTISLLHLRDGFEIRPQADEDYANRLAEWYSRPESFHREHIYLSEDRLAMLQEEVWEITQHPFKTIVIDTVDNDVDLSAFDDDFESAEVPDLEEVPDGKYQVRIDAVRLDQSQKGDPMIKWDLIVIAGTCSGRHIFKNAVITPASLPFVKGDMKTLGLSLAKFSDLPNHLESLLDQTLEVTKRTRGDFTNVYFNKRIQIPAGSQPQTPDSDIPF